VHHKDIEVKDIEEDSPAKKTSFPLSAWVSQRNKKAAVSMSYS
jgi:hypothetical protein